MGPGQGCSEAAHCARGAASRPPRAAAVSREQPEGPVPAPSTENKSAACSRPVFKARKVGATRALPGVVVLLAPTLLGTHGEQHKERHVPLPRCAGDTRGDISPAPKCSQLGVARGSEAPMPRGAGAADIQGFLLGWARGQMDEIHRAGTLHGPAVGTSGSETSPRPCAGCLHVLSPAQRRLLAEKIIGHGDRSSRDKAAPLSPGNQSQTSALAQPPRAPLDVPVPSVLSAGFTSNSQKLSVQSCSHIPISSGTVVPWNPVPLPA